MVEEGNDNKDNTFLNPMPHDLEHSDQDDVSHRGGHDLWAHSRITIEGFLSKLQFS